MEDKKQMGKGIKYRNNAGNFIDRKHSSPSTQIAKKNGEQTQHPLVLEPLLVGT